MAAAGGMGLRQRADPILTVRHPMPDQPGRLRDPLGFSLRQASRLAIREWWIFTFRKPYSP